MKVDHVNRAVTYIERKFSPVSRNNGWYECDCYYCGRKMKMGYNYASNAYKCWACPARGSLIEHVQDVEDISTFRETLRFLATFEPANVKQITKLAKLSYRVRKNIKATGLKYPTGFVPLYLADQLVSGSKVLDYIKGIGLDAEVLAAKGFGYVPPGIQEFENRLIIPFYDNYGCLVYYIGRTISKREPARYKNMVSEGVGTQDLLYNMQAIYEYDTIRVVEGWADAETLGPNSVAYLTSSMSHKQWSLLINSPVKNLQFFPDKGWYKQVKTMVLPYLDRFNIWVVDPDNFSHLSGKDANDWGKHECMLALSKTPQTTYMTCL